MSKNSNTIKANYGNVNYVRHGKVKITQKDNTITIQNDDTSDSRERRKKAEEEERRKNAEELEIKYKELEIKQKELDDEIKKRKLENQIDEDRSPLLKRKRQDLDFSSASNVFVFNDGSVFNATFGK